MPSRRQIREATVQLLYATGSADLLPEPAGSPGLALLLEPLREKALFARGRALVHLQQRRESTLEPLTDLARRASRLAVQDEECPLPKALLELQASETDLLEALAQLRRELKGAKSAEHVASLLEDCREANHRSRNAAARILDCTPAFPAFEELQQEARQVWSELRELSQQTEPALSATPGDLPELQPACNAEKRADTLAREVTRSYQSVARHLPAIDAAIASTVDNFAPERLNPVDRAILRLATCELLHDPEVPDRVAINEAIELARTFGTTDSPRFVNGILDRIMKGAPVGFRVAIVIASPGPRL